ncbi:MAG: glycosyltransferase family 4 protein [Vicinamibacterales bacterium]
MVEPPIAYVLGTFPQASQTFIAREVRGLLRRGVPLMVFALGRRGQSELEPPDREWYDQVRFVPRALAPSVLTASLHFFRRDPLQYVRALWSLLILKHRPRLLVLRAPVLFLRAAWIGRAIEQSGGCRHVHAHFALAQTEVAMAVSSLLGTSFSFTAHARDIYRSPSALEQKIRAASVVVSCTGYNVEHLRQLCPPVPPDRIQLIHHGVEVGTLPTRARQTSGAVAAPLILAAGRVVEKKGFDTLVAACRLLRTRGISYSCEIYGSGPGLATVRRHVEEAGLGDSVMLPGWASTERLLEAMSRATVFAMPSRVSKGGDRDGIPNVILEAMSMGVPVVATRVSGIPEAVEHEVTGLLVSPDSPEQLANALERVITNPEEAGRLTSAACARAHSEFALDVSSARLASLFGYEVLR